MRREVSDTPIIRALEPVQTFIDKLVSGLVATNGVQYSPVATFGTIAVAILSKLIDPGMELALSQIEVGLTQRFTERAGATGTLNYSWQVRRRDGGTTAAWATITPLLTKGIASGANSEDTLSGFIAVGTLPAAPFDIQLTALGLVASSMTGEVKSSSYVKLVGSVIPGT